MEQDRRVRDRVVEVAGVLVRVERAGDGWVAMQLVQPVFASVRHVAKRWITSAVFRATR